MPPLEMEPQPTPPKEDASFRHKRNSSGNSTPEASRQDSSPWSDEKEPASDSSAEKYMREKADPDSSPLVGTTPATAASTPMSSVTDTPSSSASSTTPRYAIRRLFPDPLSASISENDVSTDICETSMLSTTSHVDPSETTSSIRMLFQYQDRDDTSKESFQSRVRKQWLPPQAQETSPTMPLQHRFGRHGRSASLQVDASNVVLTNDSTERGARSRQRSYEYSRLHDSLSLETSLKSSCGLSERRRSSRGRISPNPPLPLVDTNSISSEEPFPSNSSSPSGTSATTAPIPRIAYAHTHHRNSSRSSLTQQQQQLSEINATSSVWMKPLVRLAHTKGLIWLLCLMALTSLCTTIITNRTMSDSNMAVNVAPLPNFNRHAARRQPTASLRGNLILSVGRKHQNESTRSLTLGSYIDGHRNKKDKPAGDKHVAKLKEEKKTKVDAKHKRQKRTERQTDGRPVSLTALSHFKDKDHTYEPSTEETKSASKIHAHEKSNTEMHSTPHGSKHARKIPSETAKPTNTAPKTPRLLPKVILPRKRKDSKARFESQDRHMYRQSTTQPKLDESARRIIFLDDSAVHMSPSHRKISLYPSDFTDNTQLYSILNSADERVKSMELREPYTQGECVPMQDWQTTFHPSCNGVHEIGLADLGEDNGDNAILFGTKGYWRNAWKVDLIGGRNEIRDKDTVVLKTLKIRHRFEEAHFEHDRIDAVAMERLTASPHVINVFGFCGHSVVSEYADGKRLGELADKSRKKPLERLKIARDIAAGLADVHGIDGDGNATFVHLDINPANVVSVGGTLKLNDFNIGIARRWNTTSNTPCGFPAQYPNPQWRSPEEARDEQNLTEKVDIFSMGHIFFRLICSHEPWNKLEPYGKPTKMEVTEKVRRGILPTIPQYILQTADPEIAAIRDAMVRCYTADATQRPSAREIANTLEQTLGRLQAASSSII